MWCIMAYTLRGNSEGLTVQGWSSFSWLVSDDHLHLLRTSSSQEELSRNLPGMVLFAVPGRHQQHPLLLQN